MSEFIKTPAYNILTNRIFPLNVWVCESEMTDEEKKANPKFYVAEGYLKSNTYEFACGEWWKSLNDAEKKIITSLPRFNKRIFKEITGIKP